MNLQNRNKVTDAENKHMVTGRGWGGSVGQDKLGYWDSLNTVLYEMGFP